MVLSFVPRERPRVPRGVLSGLQKRPSHGQPCETLSGVACTRTQIPPATLHGPFDVVVVRSQKQLRETFSGVVGPRNQNHHPPAALQGPFGVGERGSPRFSWPQL